MKILDSLPREIMLFYFDSLGFKTYKIYQRWIFIENKQTNL